MNPRYADNRRGRFNPKSLPLLQERKPPAIEYDTSRPVPAGAPAAAQAEPLAGDFPECLVYSAFIERTQTHELYDSIRGHLTLVEESPPCIGCDEYAGADGQPEDDIPVLPTPRMEFEAIVRKIPRERMQQIRQQVRREQPYGSIDGLLVMRIDKAMMERMSLTVNVEGEQRSDYAAMAKPLVRDAYGLLLRDAQRKRATSGTYHVYDFLVD